LRALSLIGFVGGLFGGLGFEENEFLCFAVIPLTVSQSDVMVQRVFHIPDHA
jgi:hypothetical protein